MQVKISISSKKGDLIRIKEKNKGTSNDHHAIKEIEKTTENTCVIKVKQNKKMIKKSKKILDELPEISSRLINLGYSIDVIKYIFARYEFSSFEQAIWILGTDPETGKYNHFFYNQPNVDKNLKNLCIVCKDSFDKHEVYPEYLTDNTEIHESHYKLIDNFENTAQNENEIMSKLKTINEKQIMLKKEFIKQLENQFTDDNLCIICYVNEISPEFSLSLNCKHLFCKNCVKHYLETRINEGHISNLKCLYAGCKQTFNEKFIQKVVDRNIFHRYLVCKNREESKNLLQKGFIPCSFPDCQEMVLYKNGNNPLVFCVKKHRFCAICKEGWHKNLDCKNKNIKNVMRSSEKIKMCPKCNMFIEKEGGCNHITCEMCGYEFCWLCLKNYEFYHYYIFNMRGCPGLKNAPSKKSSAFKNKCLNFLWTFLSILMFIIAIFLLVGFFFIFGCAYEFIKYYKNYKKKNRIDKRESSVSQAEDSNERNIKSDYSIDHIDNRSRLCSSAADTFIIVILIILGMLLQPFFLLFKFMEMIMECYRTYGCIFFWFFICDN